MPKDTQVIWEKYTDCEEQLKIWYDEVWEAIGTKPRDIAKKYPSASFLADNRVVFNIKRNSSRLIVKINYKYQMVWIRFLGTHSDYDKVDANHKKRWI